MIRDRGRSSHLLFPSIGKRHRRWAIAFYESPRFREILPRSEMPSSFWGWMKFKVPFDKRYFVTPQEAMVDGEEGTAKYAKGAKREAKILFKDESYRQSAILKQRANS